MGDTIGMQAMNRVNELVKDISGILQRRGTVRTKVGCQGVTAIGEGRLVLLADWEPQGAMYLLYLWVNISSVMLELM